MEYRDHLLGRGLTMRTVRVYERHLRRAKLWAAERDTTLLDLTPSQAHDLAEAWPESNSSRRQLRCALRYYWELHGVAGPDAAIRVPRRPRPRFRGIDDGQVRRLLAVARTDWPRGGVVYLAVYLGARREEIARLRWRDFEDNLTWVTIWGKGDRPRHMPVHPQLRAVLAPHRWPGEYVFPGRFGGHVALASINTWIREMAMRAGIEHLQPHQLRHTSGNRVYQATGDIYLAAAWLGHADVSTTRVYTQVDDRQLLEAMQAMAWDEEPTAGADVA